MTIALFFKPMRKIIRLKSFAAFGIFCFGCWLPSSDSSARPVRDGSLLPSVVAPPKTSSIFVESKDSGTNKPENSSNIVPAPVGPNGQVTGGDGQPKITYLAPPNISSRNTPAQSNKIVETFLNALKAQYGGTADINDPVEAQRLLDQNAGDPYQFGPPTGEEYRTGLLSSSAPTSLVGYNCNNNAQRDRFTCMVCNIVYEACNQSIEGQTAVARTTLTRVFNRAYPDTVCKTVYFKNGGTAAFSWTLENKDHVLRDNSCLSNAVQATQAAFRAGPNGFDHYYNASLANPSWGHGNSCRNPTHIGDHKFCTEFGDRTRTNAEVATAEGLFQGGAPYSPSGTAQ